MPTLVYICFAWTASLIVSVGLSLHLEMFPVSVLDSDDSNLNISVLYSSVSSVRALPFKQYNGVVVTLHGIKRKKTLTKVEVPPRNEIVKSCAPLTNIRFTLAAFCFADSLQIRKND